MSAFQGDSIFWIEVAKIHPNPYQPRKDFDEQSLSDLAESVRQYGVLQPLVVTRREKEKESGGISVEYELISGERRLRASKIANLFQVPVIIRAAEENEQMKLELAIIENLQREDLNAIDRAKAFHRLVEEFSFTHSQVAKRVGKSREYVSNSLRLLEMPDQIQQAVVAGQISEGHTRPLMMLNDKPQEQITVFKEVVYKKLTVRETEKIARRIAQDKIRKRKSEFDPRLQELEKNFTETLGTRVQIEPRQRGGKLVIDYFSEDDLQRFKDLFAQFQNAGGSYEAMREAFDNAAAAFTGGVSAQANEQPHQGKEEGEAMQTPDPEESSAAVSGDQQQNAEGAMSSDAHAGAAQEGPQAPHAPDTEANGYQRTSHEETAPGALMSADASGAYQPGPNVAAQGHGTADTAGRNEVWPEAGQTSPATQQHEPALHHELSQHYSEHDSSDAQANDADQGEGASASPEVHARDERAYDETAPQQHNEQQQQHAPRQPEEEDLYSVRNFTI
jgi:ParB family chromosome partitioning protein